MLYRTYFLNIIIAVIVVFTTSLSLAETKKAQDNSKDETEDSEEMILPPDSMDLVLKPGETLEHLLVNNGIKIDDAKNAIVELENLYDISHIPKEQKVSVGFLVKNSIGTDIDLTSLALQITPTRRLEVRKMNDIFVAQVNNTPTIKKLVKLEAVVKTTFFSAAKDAKIPPSILMQLIKNYSYDVDFQRDISVGNKLEIMFEQTQTDKGEIVSNGDIIYSLLQLGERKIYNYRYVMADGHAVILDENGQSIQKSFLMTPIDGARVTSSFGKRKHPILGFTKIHRGVDFGAHMGTPVYAAADGVIIEREHKGSYGNFVKIHHDSNYDTAYAHLQKYAKGIKKGSQVKQGQVIAYVGSTGRSTGPHLHYELIFKGKQINPLSIRTTSANQLSGPEDAVFEKHKQKIDGFLKEIDAGNIVAVPTSTQSSN